MYVKIAMTLIQECECLMMKKQESIFDDVGEATLVWEIFKI